MSLSLECWGHDWEWLNCGNIPLTQVPLKRLALAPFTSHALRLNLAPIYTPRSSIDPLSLMSQVENDNITMATDFFTEGEHPDSRVILTRLTEKETLIVNGVNPNQIYRITLTPHKNINFSTVFFKINDNETIPWSAYPKARTTDGNLLARAEEISIVVLILALWMMAIALFVHRWGKIRMLEPYQPDYKAIHDANCPMNTSTSPQLVPPPAISAPRSRPPTFKNFPRKSSSLCFTPSMLQTLQMSPNCRMSVPRLDSYSQALKGHPRLTLHRIRGRFSTESSSHRNLHGTNLCRKARSAENLRHIRSSPVKIAEDCQKQDHSSSSLESYRGTIQEGGPSSSGVVPRGVSLDSSSQVKKSFGGVPWWTQAMGVTTPYPEGRSNPEIRISPTPPERCHSCPHSRAPGLQRQDPLDETLTPAVVPYATLHEEENETDEASAAIGMSQESLESQEFHTGYSSQESQETQPHQESLEVPIYRHSDCQEKLQHTCCKYQRDRRLVHMSQVTPSTSQDSQNSDSIRGSRDSSV